MCVTACETMTRRQENDDTITTTKTTHIRERREIAVVGRKEGETKDLTCGANLGNNSRAGPKYHNYRGPRKRDRDRDRKASDVPVVVSPHALLTVGSYGGRRGEDRGVEALNRFYRAITVGAIVRHYLETSLSILHGPVWTKREKKVSRKQASEPASEPPCLALCHLRRIVVVVVVLLLKTWDKSLACPMTRKNSTVGMLALCLSSLSLSLSPPPEYVFLKSLRQGYVTQGRASFFFLFERRTIARDAVVRCTQHASRRCV